VQAPPGLAGWNGPYLKKKTIPKDPWGNDYRYVSPGQHGSYDISSLGADNKEGGEGENKDINGWEDSKK
jgi:general secretion pathway protein G